MNGIAKGHAKCDLLGEVKNVKFHTDEHRRVLLKFTLMVYRLEKSERKSTSFNVTAFHNVAHKLEGVIKDGMTAHLKGTQKSFFKNGYSGMEVTANEIEIKRTEVDK